MVGFLHFVNDKTDAELFVEKAKPFGLESWIHPPQVPDYKWQIYAWSDSLSAKKIERAMVTTYAVMGYHFHEVVPKNEFRFEGPFDNFPYPGGKCQAIHRGVDCEGNKCEELTPYEVRLRRLGEAKDIFDAGDDLFKWTPRCAKHLIEWMEDADGPFSGDSSNRVEIRLVQGQNLLTGEGNNVEVAATPGTV